MDPKLHQQLLELHYDLLSEDEAQALRARIQSEPELAEAMVRVSRDAQCIASAARLEAPPIGLKLDPAVVAKPETHSLRSGGGKLPGKIAGKQSTWGWAIGLAAGILLVLSLGGYRFHSYQVARLDRDFARVLLAGPAELEPGVSNHFTLTSSTVSGQPLPMELTASLHKKEGGDVVQLDRVETDAEGQVSLDFKPAATMAGEYELRLARVAGNSQTPLAKLPLQVAEGAYLTALSTDRPVYQPGDDVYYRSVSLRRSDLQPLGDSAVRYRAESATGEVLAASELAGLTAHGVGNGSFTLPADLPYGNYKVYAESENSQFAAATQEFLVAPPKDSGIAAKVFFNQSDYLPGERVLTELEFRRADGAPLANSPVDWDASVGGEKLIASNVQLDGEGRAVVEFPYPTQSNGAVSFNATAQWADQTALATAEVPAAVSTWEARFYPEGGELVAGVSNRVYFSVHDQLNRPIQATGKIVDAQDHVICTAETRLAGRGAFQLTPQAGQTYRLRLTDVDDASLWPSLPTVRADQSLALSVPQPVLPRGEDALKAIVNDRRGGTPIVIAVAARGRLVAQSTGVTSAGSNELTTSLRDDAEGVLRVTVYDCSRQSPRPVAERLVYRHPTKRLTVALSGMKDGLYQPEDAVSVRARVTDEADRPASGAVLGVSVINRELLRQGQESPQSVERFFYLASQIDRPEEMEELDPRLDESPDSAVAIDLLLGTQGWRTFVEASDLTLAQSAVTQQDGERVAAQGLLVWDNLDQIKPNYEARSRKLRGEHAQLWATLMICGGLALAIALVLATLWRLVSSLEFALPSLVAAAGCVVLGALLARSPESGVPPTASVAFSRNVPAPTVALRSSTSRDRDAELKPELDQVDRDEAREAIGKVAADPVDKKLSEGEPVDGAPPTRSEPGPPIPAPRAAAEPEAPRPEAPPLAPADERFDAHDAPVASKAPAARAGRAMRGAQEAPLSVQDMAFGGVTRPVSRTTSVTPLDSGSNRRQLYRGVTSEFLEEEASAPERFSKEPATRSIDDSTESNLLERAAEAPESSSQTRFSGQFQPKQTAERAEGDVQVVQQDGVPITIAPLVVRKYAHAPQATSSFAELYAQPSLYWNPLLVADEDGNAAIDFYSGAGEANYQLRVDAHDGNGRLGGASARLRVGLPVALAQSLPEQVTKGDRAYVDVQMQNNTSEPQSVEMNSVGEVPALVADAPVQRFMLNANESRQAYFPFQAESPAENGVMFGVEGNTRTANSLDIRETVASRLAVTPAGYPHTWSKAGWLSERTTFDVEIPADAEPDSLSVKLWLYPGVAADYAHARKSLEGLPQDNWNTRLALAYVDSRLTGVPIAEEVQMLAGAPLNGPSASGGFAGAAPETLSFGAFRHYWYQPTFDAPAVANAQQRGGYGGGGYLGGGYLPGQRGSGSDAQRNNARSRAAYSMQNGAVAGRMGVGPAPGGTTQATQSDFGYAGLASAPPEVVTSWELANRSAPQAGGGESKELNQALDYARRTPEPTSVAVTANAAMNYGEVAAGNEMLDRLAKWQEQDGSVKDQNAPAGSTQTVADTAVAALAWLRAPEYRDQAEKAVAWLLTQRREGGFGSADDTYLALRALEAHANAGLRTVGAGDVIVTRNGSEVARKTLTGDETGLIELGDLTAQLNTGNNALTLTNSSGVHIPYALEVHYHAPRPQDNANWPVTVQTMLANARVKLGDEIPVQVEIVNSTDTAQEYLVAEIGLPAGLEVSAEQLEAQRNEALVDHFEFKPRTAITYFRNIKPNETRRLNLNAKAVAPGEFTAPPTSVYRLTAPEQRNWAAPLKAEIAPPVE